MTPSDVGKGWARVRIPPREPGPGWARSSLPPNLPSLLRALLARKRARAALDRRRAPTETFPGDVAPREIAWRYFRPVLGWALVTRRHIWVGMPPSESGGRQIRVGLLPSEPGFECARAGLLPSHPGLPRTPLDPPAARLGLP
jgi:hypothetical protein